MKYKTIISFFFLVSCMTFAVSSTLLAAEKPFKKMAKNKKQPVLLKADSISHDHETSITTAKGHVLFFRGEEILEADVVTFNQQTNTVIATGNVVLTKKPVRKKAKETVYFTNYIELTSDLKTGFIKEVKAILSDNSKFVATSGKKQESKSRFHNARYSPCKVCRHKKDSPLWELSAKTATWLEDTHDVVYTDAFMHFWGIPVFYLPYFRHPDPSVKRRSGLLVPLYGHNNTLGAFAQIPYFYEIDSDKDITLTPLLTKEGGQFLGTNFRYVFQRGHTNLKTSGGRGSLIKQTEVKGKTKETEETKFRGHIDANLMYKITENWRLTGTLLRVTDKTYLSKYPFYGYTSPGTLDSNAIIEAFYPRTYLRIKSQYTQSTRENDRQRHIPLIIPAMDINYESRPQKWGSWWNIDGNILSIQRKAGKSTQRAIGSIGWSLPWYGFVGDRFILNLVGRGDIYDTSDTSDNLKPGEKQLPDKTYSRFFPQGRLLWELPFYNNLTDYTIIVGPEVSLVTSPILSKTENFPNEDNYLREPSDTSLFNLNRLQGYDRLDEGTRVTYGMKAALYRSSHFQVEGFLGQTHHFNQTKRFFKGTGFEQENSDLVGRFNASILKYLDLRCRFRLDKRELTLRRNELGVSIGGHFFKANFDYLHLPPKLVDEDIGNSHLARGTNREIAGQQIQVGFTANPHRNWHIKAATLEALGENGRSLAHNGSIEYHNECLILDFNIRKNYYVNQEIKPDTTYWARITFKNLGSIVSPRWGGASHDKNSPDIAPPTPISF